MYNVFWYYSTLYNIFNLTTRLALWMGEIKQIWHCVSCSSRQDATILPSSCYWSWGHCQIFLCLERTQTRLKTQYNAELALSPRLHVKPLTTAIRAVGIFTEMHKNNFPQAEAVCTKTIFYWPSWFSQDSCISVHKNIHTKKNLSKIQPLWPQARSIPTYTRVIN